MNFQFGDILSSPTNGRGMVYALTTKGLPLVQYQSGAICGNANLTKLGSIYDLPLPAKSAPDTDPRSLLVQSPKSRPCTIAGSGSPDVPALSCPALPETKK